MSNFEHEPKSENQYEVIPGVICEVIDDGEAVQVDIQDYRLIYYKNTAGEIKIRSEANMVKQTGSYEIPQSVKEQATEAATDVFGRGSSSPYLEANQNGVSSEEAQAHINEVKTMLDQGDDSKLN